MLTRDLLGQGIAWECLGGLKVQPPPDEHGVNVQGEVWADEPSDPNRVTWGMGEGSVNQ
jgi:hypothetical protein